MLQEDRKNILDIYTRSSSTYTDKLLNQDTLYYAMLKISKNKMKTYSLGNMHANNNLYLLIKVT